MENDALFLFETLLYKHLHIVLHDRLENMGYMYRDDAFVEIQEEGFPLYEKHFPE